MEAARKEEFQALLHLHLEPAEPIEVGELTAALASLSRRYQAFATDEGYGGKAAEARLLVASVSPGSIDINLLPDLGPSMALLAVIIPHGEVLAKFVDVLGKTFDLFRGDKRDDAKVTVKDCDDAVNITAPIAHHGGSQTFNVINADAVITGPTIVMTADVAREILEGATRERARLEFPARDDRQRVSMIWTRLDRDKAKTEGVRSPDHGRIDEIDEKPHAVMFTDEMTYLKDEMIADEENPYQKVYFVDVQISRVGDRITGYRVTGYHGKDDLD